MGKPLENRLIREEAGSIVITPTHKLATALSPQIERAMMAVEFTVQLPVQPLDGVRLPEIEPQSLPEAPSMAVGSTAKIVQIRLLPTAP